MPCADFSENYSMAVNNIIFRILLLIFIKFGLSTKTVNVKTAFLHGELEEEIYMDCSSVMKNVSKNDYIILRKYIYSLAQSTWQYNKKIIEILKKVGLTGGNIDPCLYMKKIKGSM